MTDRPISKKEADEHFEFVLQLFVADVNSLLKVPVRQHQFDALVSFAFNVGSDIDQDSIPEGLGDSTLLRLVNQNPNDPRIVGEFLKWNKAGGRIVRGLVRRRTVEAHYYATGNLDLKRTKL